LQKGSKQRTESPVIGIHGLERVVERRGGGAVTEFCTNGSRKWPNLTELVYLTDFTLAFYKIDAGMSLKLYIAYDKVTGFSYR